MFEKSKESQGSDHRGLGKPLSLSTAKALKFSSGPGESDTLIKVLLKEEKEFSVDYFQPAL